MSADNDDQPTSFQSERSLFVAGFLLFFLGGLYWFFSTPPSTYPATQTESTAEPTLTVAEPVPQTEESTGGALSENLTNDSRITTKTKKSASSAKTSRANDRVTDKPVRETVESAPEPIGVTSAAVEKHVVAVTPPAPVVQPETTPLTKPVANPVLAKAETKKKGAAPAEMKPVAQPIQTPASPNASPALKRKTKNDEDVEVDLN